MDLGQARALVRDYINEPVEKTWTDAKLNALVQEANRQIYLEVANTSPSWFSIQLFFSIPANQVTPLDLPSTLAILAAPVALGEPVRILGLYALPSAAVPSMSNVPVPLKPFTRISDLLALESTARDGQYPMGNGNPGSLRLGYVTLGPKLYVWPVPQQAVPVMIFYIPSVATPVVDADNLLVPYALAAFTPQLVNNHELIPMLAAMKAKAQVGDPDNGLSTLYANRLKALKDSLAIQLQIQDPAQVRGIGW